MFQVSTYKVLIYRIVLQHLFTLLIIGTMYVLDPKMFKYRDGDSVCINMYYIQSQNVDSNKISNTSNKINIFYRINEKWWI